MEDLLAWQDFFAYLPAAVVFVLFWGTVLTAAMPRQQTRLEEPLQVIRERPSRLKVYRSSQDRCPQHAADSRGSAISAMNIEGGLWQHFNGDRYWVLGVAKHSETLEPMVIYHPDEKPQDVWVGPLLLWHEEMKPGLKRFTKVEIKTAG